MSLLVLGFGHVIDDHDVLAVYGGESCYAIPNTDGSYTPPYGSGDMDMDEAVEGLSGLTMSSGAAGGAGMAASLTSGSSMMYSTSTISPPTVFDDYRIVGKTVINVRLTNLVGTVVYMTTYRCDSDATLSCIFTFEPPFVSRTCFNRAEPLSLEAAQRPAYITDDQLILLGSLLSVGSVAAPFIFHGVLDMLD